VPHAQLPHVAQGHGWAGWVPDSTPPNSGDPISDLADRGLASWGWRRSHAHVARKRPDENLPDGLTSNNCLEDRPRYIYFKNPPVGFFIRPRRPNKPNLELILQVWNQLINERVDFPYSHLKPLVRHRRARWVRSGLGSGPRSFTEYQLPQAEQHERENDCESDVPDQHAAPSCAVPLSQGRSYPAYAAVAQ
jgi:hypothetical protein